MKRKARGYAGERDGGREADRLRDEFDPSASLDARVNGADVDVCGGGGGGDDGEDDERLLEIRRKRRRQGCGGAQRMGRRQRAGSSDLAQVAQLRAVRHCDDCCYVRVLCRVARIAWCATVTQGVDAVIYIQSTTDK